MVSAALVLEQGRCRRSTLVTCPTKIVKVLAAVAGIVAVIVAGLGSRWRSGRSVVVLETVIFMRPYRAL